MVDDWREVCSFDVHRHPSTPTISTTPFTDSRRRHHIDSRRSKLAVHLLSAVSPRFLPFFVRHSRRSHPCQTVLFVYVCANCGGQRFVQVFGSFNFTNDRADSSAGEPILTVSSRPIYHFDSVALLADNAADLLTMREFCDHLGHFFLFPLPLPLSTKQIDALLCSFRYNFGYLDQGWTWF